MREVESSSVFKFFVHVQGKTKLETNMQAAALLPHWNTFEARAMRVVISDLPASFPEAVVQCLKAPNENGDSPALVTVSRCLDALAQLITTEKHAVAEHLLATAHNCVTRCRDLAASRGDPAEPRCMSERLHGLADQHTMGRILRLHGALRAIRTDLVEVLRRTWIHMNKPEAVSH